MSSEYFFFVSPSKPYTCVGDQLCPSPSAPHELALFISAVSWFPRLRKTLRGYSPAHLISDDPLCSRRSGLTFVRKQHNHNLGTPRPPIDEIAVKQQRMRRRRLARQRKQMNKVVELPMRISNPAPPSAPHLARPKQRLTHRSSPPPAPARPPTKAPLAKSFAPQE